MEGSSPTPGGVQISQITKVHLFTIRTRNRIRGVGNLPSLPPRHVFYGRLVHSLETVDVAWHLLHDDRILCAAYGPLSLWRQLHRAEHGSELSGCWTWRQVVIG